MEVFSIVVTFGFRHLLSTKCARPWTGSASCMWKLKVYLTNILWLRVGRYMSTSKIIKIIISNGNRTEWSPIRSIIIRVITGSPICLSRVWLQTELDNTKSYYQLIIKITISEKRRIPRYEKGKFTLKVLHCLYGDWNQECDWLI